MVAMMLGGGDESIDRPNDQHAVVGMHVDGVDGHVDDDLVIYDYMAYPLRNSNSGGRAQTVRRKFNAKHSPNMYCRIPQNIVGQNHVEKCLTTYHF